MVAGRIALALTALLEGFCDLVVPTGHELTEFFIEERSFGRPLRCGCMNRP